MENQILCPFSFIGGESREDQDMNEMFIAGYRDKVCTDFTHSSRIDEIKQEINFNNPSDAQISWMHEIKYQDSLALGNCIIQYLIDNITDLTINTLIIFMQNAGMPIETIDYFVSDLHKPDGIRQTITEIVVGTDLPISRSYSEYAQFQLLDIAMGSIYAKIISKVFEEFIDKIMSAITATGIEKFYALVYQMVYDNEPVETNYSNMYNLCIATMREMLDKQTINYRGTLMQIANNVVKMISGSSKFALEVSNPNYITDPEEFIENSGLFISKDVFKNLNGVTE